MFNDVNELISWIESQKRIVPKTSLEKMFSLCDVFDSPQKKIKYVHVGGTNGKGSTVSYIKTVLMTAGYNVGTYVSPYVISFNERIEFNNEYISDDDVLEIGNYIISKYDEIERRGIVKPTFFEFITLMAFIYFSRIENLDIVVLEVGLGGLLDSTNVVTPLVSVITNVAFDHMKVLGDTIEEIAMNKLGIVKGGIPLITLENPKLNDIFINRCQETGSNLILVRKSDIRNIEVSRAKTIFDYKEYKKITTNLLGYYQTENASISLEVLNYLRNNCGYKITDENIYQGFNSIKWPGRLQVLSSEPYIIIDGAHNIDGITRLAEFLKAIKENKRLTVIFAVSKDKAKDQMITVLDELADEIIFTMFHYKRSDTPEYLFDLSKNPNKKLSFDLDELLEEAFNRDKDEIIVFCGSLYFVSEILNKIKDKE
ncbi:MAG: bifunctional folylpolyglutamate synthase/dihydrofolate synthase [Candidatus Izemoplasmatales bacterium]|nr:bifunctional folylpolyglutamate synthase/dihydrofolate synthase [Candidatus Izemoplasmatales bacterium]